MGRATAAYPTLNVIAAVVQEASLRAQIAASQDIIKAESEELDLLNQQFQLGAVARSAVLQQAVTLAQEKASAAGAREAAVAGARSHRRSSRPLSQSAAGQDTRARDTNTAAGIAS